MSTANLPAKRPVSVPVIKRGCPVPVSDEITVPDLVINECHRKFTDFRAAAKSSLIERDGEIDLALAALVANESVLFVGPPGTAKSMLSDAIVRLVDGNQFSRLLTKFTMPEELFGPVSLMGLKNDEFRRIGTGMLPEADVVFLDEVFKANSAILNTLLKEMLDKSVALFIGASNEWPNSQEGGQELGAFFDRFLFRQTVRPIITDRGIDKLLWSPSLDIPVCDTITRSELDAVRADAASMAWSADAQEALVNVLRRCRAEGIRPGDRRVRKSVGAVQAYAWLAGEPQVEAEHLEILGSVLWEDPGEQAKAVTQIIASVANPTGSVVQGLLVEAEEIYAAVSPGDTAQSINGTKKLQEILKKLAGVSGKKAQEAHDHVQSLCASIFMASVEARG